MSVSTKTFIRAPLARFTSDIEYRGIVVESTKFESFTSQLTNCMTYVNKEINALSLYVEKRNIPYIVAQPVTYGNAPSCPNKRIVVRDCNNAPYQGRYCPECGDENSYIIECQLSPFYRQITFSNATFDAKLVVDQKYLRTAAIDLFLDSAMFNSYSFLRKMSIAEKKEFSKNKFDYFKMEKLDCFYTYDQDDPLLYYSIAFSARTNENTIDYAKYLRLWDSFLKIYYPEQKHIEESLADQLKKHRQYGQLPHNSILRALESKPSGTYLLIKVNSNVRKSKARTQLGTLFGTDSPSSKHWKIIKFEEYHTIYKFLQDGKISAFKLIKY